MSKSKIHELKNDIERFKELSISNKNMCTPLTANWCEYNGMIHACKVITDYLNERFGDETPLQKGFKDE